MRNYDDRLFVLKALAMLSVITAHCSFSLPKGYVVNKGIGCIGVPIFFMLAGYFLNPKEQWKVFWKKKIHTIIIPWVILGIATYLISLGLFSRDVTAIPRKLVKFDIIDCVLWMIGWNTWLYFVPVLLECFLILRLGKGNRKYLYIILIISCLSNALSVIGLTEYKAHMNPFNWILFMIAGVMVRENMSKCRAVCKSKIFKIVAISLWIIGGVFYFTHNVGYFEYYSVPYELLSVMILFFMAGFLYKIPLLSAYLTFAGKQTYFIYFVHMQLGIYYTGKILNILGIERFLYEHLIGVLLFPFFVMGIICAVISVVMFLGKKYHVDKALIYFGIRVPESKM